MQRTFTAALAAAFMGCAAVIASDTVALAQSMGPSTSERSSQQRVRTARPRIVVTPTTRLHRHCVDWYSVERRATGNTVVPNMRCWWAYR